MMKIEPATTPEVFPQATPEHVSIHVDLYDLLTREAQHRIITRRVKMLSELNPLSKEIKEHCMTIFLEPYYPRKSLEDFGILDTVRNHLPDSHQLFGEMIYHTPPFAYHHLREVLIISRTQ